MSNAKFRPPNSASPPVLVLPPQGVATMRLKRRARYESAEDAIRRARQFSWYPRVTRRQPYSTAAYWLFAVGDEEGT